MKLYMKSLLIIVIITALGAGGVTWYKYSRSSEAKANVDGPTIDEILAESVDIDPITTNLKDGGIIKTKYKIICSSAKNAAEIKKLSFQIQSTIIQYMNGLKKEDLSGEKGLTSLETNLKNKINQTLGGEYIKQIYTTEKMIQ